MQISRNQLRSKLWSLTANLKGPGSLEDPVESAVGWSLEKTYRFDSQLERYSGNTVKELKRSVRAHLSSSSSSVRKWGVGALGLMGLAMGAMAAAPAIGVGIAAGLAAGGLLAATGCTGKMIARHLESGRASETARGLETWERAFEGNIAETSSSSPGRSSDVPLAK